MENKKHTKPDINLDDDTELDIDDDFCHECNGEGVFEDYDSFGLCEVPCPYCSELSW